MAQKNIRSNPIFCDDRHLSYDDNLTEFVGGEGLLFDETYRLAHLPLVAPDHSRVIRTKPGTSYNRGIHDSVFSIAIPVSANQLLTSQEFNRLCDELKVSMFAQKISWDTFSQRKDKLHATICGAISTVDPPRVNQKTYEMLRQIGPVSIKICGLFSGNMNIGRLYLKVYPEQRAGKNMCHVIQRIFDSTLTNMYLVGLFNFVEELDVHEAQELDSLLKRWQDVEILQIELEELWMLKSRDDLVLNGNIEKTIPIV